MRKEDYTSNEHNNDNNSYNKRHSKACCLRDYGSQIHKVIKVAAGGPSEPSVEFPPLSFLALKMFFFMPFQL